MATTGDHGIIIPDPSTAGAVINDIRALALQVEAGLADVEAEVIAGIDLSAYATVSYVNGLTYTKAEIDALVADSGTSETLITTANFTVTGAGDYVAQVPTSVLLPSGGTVVLAAGDFVVVRQLGGTWYAETGTLPVAPPAEPDDTPPTAGTLTVTGVTDTSATLTVSGASDDQALHAAPYRFSTDAGSTWTGYQSGTTHTPTLAPSTTYQPRVMVRDAQGNTATATAADFTTASAPLPTGPVSVTHLYSGANAATTAAQSYSGVPLGAAHQHRLIVVATVARRTTTRTISSATIGGVPATAVNTGSGSYSINFAYAVVPTGTTGDIALTFSGGLDSGGSVIDVFEVVNTVKTHSGSKAQDTALVAVVPASPAGGLVLLYATREGSSGGLNMTGGTEVIDYQAGDFGQVAAYWATATGSDITLTEPNTPSPRTAAVVFDKAA